MTIWLSRSVSDYSLHFPRLATSRWILPEVSTWRHEETWMLEDRMFPQVRRGSLHRKAALIEHHITGGYLKSTPRESEQCSKQGTRAVVDKRQRGAWAFRIARGATCHV